MWSIQPPLERVDTAFDLCTSGNQTDLVRRLMAGKTDILSAAGRFLEAVKAGACWRLTGDDFRVSGVTGGEMRHVYEYYFVRGGARCLYDGIMAQSILRRCPLCECGHVATLDHFLPKGVFSALAIDPLNLVPACRDCNAILSSDLADSPETEHIHPYFWHDEDNWLTGSVIQTDAPFVEFRVKCPEEWPTTKTKRVEAHFARLELGRRLAVASASAVQEVICSLSPLMRIGEPELIRSHLVDAAESTAKGFGENYWRTVMLRTLADDEWFWLSGVWGQAS